MKLPDFSYEKRCWSEGYNVVIGVDEVGRGAFAGPLVAAAASVKSIKYQVLRIKYKNRNTKIPNTNYQILNTILKLGINDSKKLAAKKREDINREIRKYFNVGIGEASVGEINRYGIVAATERAMRRAVNSIKQVLSIKYKSKIGNKIHNPYYIIPNTKCFLLIDAYYVKYTAGIPLKRQKAIINGDGKSVSIAAASIVAKVYRDKLMENLSTKYTQYGWERNAGYGTVYHRNAIEKFGICKMHRSKFVDGLDARY